MRICLLNFKGGVGRTTLSLNLAGFYASQDPLKRVLVADCDPQGSALAWASLADETPFTVGRSRSRGFDIEILDMPPRLPENGILPSVDLFVVPTLLDGVAYVVYLRTIQLLNSQGLPFITVANKVNFRRAEHRDRLSCEALKGATVVREQAALAGYYAQGLTVHTGSGRHIEAARADIEGVASAIETAISARGGRA